MTELGIQQRVWLMRAAFSALAFFIFFIHLLPLQTTPTRGFAAPDLIMLFAFAWSVRRPDFVPPVLLAIVFLLADLLLQRPPGLWAALLLIGTERLKSQSTALRNANFLAEVVTVGALIVALFVANRLLLSLLIVDVPAFGLWMVHVVMTLVCYPFVVFVTHWGLGVRKAAPGDLGQREV